MRGVQPLISYFLLLVPFMHLRVGSLNGGPYFTGSWISVSHSSIGSALVPDAAEFRVQSFGDSGVVPVVLLRGKRHHSVE